MEEEYIKYLLTEDRKIIVRTNTNDYHGALLKQLDFILSFYGFERVNNNKIVNMHQVKMVDWNENKLFFDENKEEFVYFSRRNKKKVSKYFDK